MPGDSKTEKASPKKRRDERKKGNVFKSQDIITIISLVGCFYGLKYLFPFIYRQTKAFMIRYIGFIGEFDTLSNDRVMEIQISFIEDAAKGTLPLLMISATLAILAVGVQTKFLFTMSSLAPKFNRLNPLEGIKKLFAAKNAVELLKNLIKITILIILLVQFMAGRVIEILSTLNMDLMDSGRYILIETVELIELVAMWFAAIASFDLFYQWWDYERQIKMSKQELKEEYKQMEGNPEIKAKIKELQRMKARSRMMQAVPDADVVIRNPTHFAVALKYDNKVHAAPLVIAKGRDELALRIVKIAEENKVAIIEDQPLARALYASTDLNREIPQEYYGTVAEILVYVYKLNHKEID